MPLVEGEDTIAGRKAWTLRLKPKRKRLPWKQLWIDKETFVVLASRDWSSANKIKRTMKTTWISYRVPRSPPILERPAYSMEQDADSQLKAAALLLAGRTSPTKYLPKGFKLVNVEVDYNDSCVRLVYSDGLYALSVLVGDAADRAGERLRAGRAYDWGQGLMVFARANGRNVLIVGDLPVEEIKKIAGSVQ